MSGYLAEIQKQNPESIVELYELDGNAIGMNSMYFHADLTAGPIFWQGIQYDPWPLEARDFARTSEQQPTPKLIVANIDGRISQLCMQLEDMVGTIVKRKRTFVKFLDGTNFPPLRNLLAESSFEASVSGSSLLPSWRTSSSEATTVSYGTGTPVGGSRYARVTATLIGSNQYAGVEPNISTQPKPESGKTYTLSGYMRGTPGATAQMIVQYRDATTDTVTFTRTQNFVLTSSFTRYVLAPALAPANTGQCRTIFRIIGGATSASMFLEVDNVQFEEGTTASDYVFTSSNLVADRNPDADPNEQMPPEIWYIERKAAENRESVSFELVSAFDLDGVKLPRRQVIANYCTWKSVGGYRSSYCGYTGPAVAQADGTPTTDPGKDACGGKLSDCRLRQWPDNVLNFGGFPAAGLMRT